MSFDLTNKNIQDTFQNLLQQTGSNGEVYDLEGNRVTNLSVNTISSSILSGSSLAIKAGPNRSGNELHSRGGTLYFGDTNLETGGSGLSNVVEDTSPELGGNLNLNNNEIRGIGRITVNTADTNDFFLLKSGSFDSLKMNGQGVLVLGGFTFEPTAIKGGVYYNDTEDEFYAGKNN